MNIHVMFLLLALAAPKHRDMPLLEQPQVSAPMTLKEDAAWRWEIRAKGEGQ